MQVKKIGEFALIKRLSRRLKFAPSVIKGPGDDCAVLKFNSKTYQLFTCDMVVEGVDFTARDNPALVGRKALAVSISDIAACGGVPDYALVSMGFPEGIPVEKVEKIFQGMRRLAEEYRISLVGGDLSRARELAIEVSMLGRVEKKYLALRSGAKKGDIIFVSGPLGGSIQGKHLRFNPRIKEARFLVRNFRVGAMIDISDGLAQDLGHILKESSAGAVIYAGLIPLSRQAEGLGAALSSGEDFELLFTLPRPEAKKLIRRGRGVFYPIGEIADKKYGLRLVDKTGRERKLEPCAFRHF